MASNYKRYRVRVQLECGHTETVKVEPPSRVPDEFQPCGQCKCHVAVWAIECREWRAKCMQCRFTRWHGQSEFLAKETANRHYEKTQHQIFTRYVINPVTFEIVKRFRKYGGRYFRYRIEEQTVGLKRVPVPRRIGLEPDVPQF